MLASRLDSVQLRESIDKEKQNHLTVVVPTCSENGHDSKKFYAYNCLCL